MTYSACDLADHTAEMLFELGYVVDPLEPDGDGDSEHHWDIGTRGVGGQNSTANAACADALTDAVNRFKELQLAAALTIGAMEKGDLAAAVRSLQQSLDACIPGEVMAFISSAQSSVSKNA